MTTEPLELGEAFDALDLAVERFKGTLALVATKGIGEYSLSVEANENRFKQVIERAREMIIKAYRWVRKVIREFITGHLIRLERFYDTLIKTERDYNQYQKDGLFSRPVRGYIDNLSIARDLYVKQGISFSSANQAHSNVNTLIAVAASTYRERVKVNKKLLERSKDIESIEDLRRFVNLPTGSELTRNSADGSIRDEVRATDNITVFVSNPLPSNRSVAFLSPTQDSNTLGFANTPYGLRFVRTQDIDMNDRRLYRIPVLSGQEIKTMIFNIRRNLGDLRNIVDSVNDAESELERTENSAKRMSLSEDATRSVQDLVLDFLTNSVRNDARLLVTTMTLSSDYLFACHQWILKSIETYKEGSK